MKVLFFGDTVGRSGRTALLTHIPDLRRRLDLDLVVVNGENVAGGFGITAAICTELYAAGADVITTGNHIWGQREIIPHLDRDERLLRPHNFPPGTPGRGVGIYSTRGGKKAMVMNVMTQLFMDPLDDPFACVEAELAKVRLGVTVDAIVIDVHGEATSEKTALGVLADGRASLVVGSHTHVPTADWRILPGGTAYQTDAGMCGDYDSVIGMEKTEPLVRFRRKFSQGRLQPAQGEATLCGTYVETNDKTGLAVYIAPLRLGGKLAPAWPIATNEPR
ncbi:MAG: YmdB family metallophosphoesterase [Alphaproteobacteria bacterium]|nr:YmdB family metallophosphoesterase [Alphaproteobacteria bacterium]